MAMATFSMMKSYENEDKNASVTEVEINPRVGTGKEMKNAVMTSPIDGGERIGNENMTANEIEAVTRTKDGMMAEVVIIIEIRIEIAIEVILSALVAEIGDSGILASRDILSVT